MTVTEISCLIAPGMLSKAFASESNRPERKYERRGAGQGRARRQMSRRTKSSYASRRHSVDQPGPRSRMSQGV